jgi:uncharacterized protein YgfB (UPF0149 family)
MKPGLPGPLYEMGVRFQFGTTANENMLIKKCQSKFGWISNFYATISLKSRKCSSAKTNTFYVSAVSLNPKSFRCVESVTTV